MVMMSLIEILIVEDEKLVADDLRETLELLGYCVPFLATSAEAALEKLKCWQPNLVLMDIRLAGEMDGIEASRIIQAQYQIPVIYLTANTDRGTLDRAKVSHPFGYIVKPFNESTLTTTIEIALERHQAEASIHHALNDALVQQTQTEQLLQQKSDYLHMVAHELRNPLTVIKFAADVLYNADNEMTDDRREQYIQKIHAATKNLNALLEDILLLERSESYQLECFPSLVNLADFCHELVEAFRLTTDGTHHFSLTHHGKVTLLNLDEKLLWHLLSNLVSNAVKYSPKGGTVSVHLDWREDCVCLSITDQGIGIPSELQPRLFEPFQRGQNVGSIPGTGLGLAIAKRCTELQGGCISVQSTLNQGTTFTVVFPFNNSLCSYYTA